MRELLAAWTATALLAGVSADAVSAAPPSPPPPNPPLTGETLQGSAISNPVANCATGSYSFDVTGTAVGPYAGPFTESVSVTQSNLASVPLDIAVPLGNARIDASSGAVATLSASFMITSPTGTVTGTKTLALPNTVVSTCGDSALVTSAGISQRVPAYYLALNGPPGSLSYSATITSPLGTSTDGGTTDIAATFLAIQNIGQFAAAFTENFASTGPVTPPAGPGNSPGTEPGKGCGDQNHAHEKSGECKK
jgi:hypothetical protein